MKTSPATKLDLDFEAPSGLLPRMDGDTDDLTLQICSRIGMIMEDGSALALTIGSLDQRDAACRDQRTGNRRRQEPA